MSKVTKIGVQNTIIVFAFVVALIGVAGLAVACQPETVIVREPAFVNAPPIDGAHLTPVVQKNVFMVSENPLVYRVDDGGKRVSCYVSAQDIFCLKY